MRIDDEMESGVESTIVSCSGVISKADCQPLTKLFAGGDTSHLKFLFQWAENLLAHGNGNNICLRLSHAQTRVEDGQSATKSMPERLTPDTKGLRMQP